jgi:hypothetical protein
MEEKMEVEEFVKKSGWSESDRVTEAVADVVRRNVSAGDASWYYGASVGIVVALLQSAENEGIKLT